MGAGVVLETQLIRGLATGWLRAGPERPDENLPVLFFIHGFPDDAESWQEQIAYFSTRFLILAPFLRGSGPSLPGSDRRRFSLSAVALDHLEILRAESVRLGASRRVVVIGHDIGGIHAVELAHLLGPRLIGLTLINAPSLEQMARRILRPKQVAKSWYIGVFLLPRVAERWFGPGKSGAVRAARRKGGLAADLPLPTSVAPLLEHYRAFFRALPSVLRARRKHLNAPVLVIAGKDDAFLEVPTESELARFAEHAEIRVLDGNHWLQLDHATQVNRMIEKFLCSVGGAS